MHEKLQLTAPCAAFLVMLQVQDLCLVTQQGTHRSSVLPWWVHTQAHKSILADKGWACSRPTTGSRHAAGQQQGVGMQQANNSWP